MNVKNVKVECFQDENGEIVPRQILRHDGRTWNITRVIFTCISCDGKFEGIRYAVLIGSAEKNLYRLGSQWYVDSG